MQDCPPESWALRLSIRLLLLTIMRLPFSGARPDMNNYRVESNKEQKTENALIASVFLALTLRNQTWYPSALNHLRSIPDCGHGAPS